MELLRLATRIRYLKEPKKYRTSLLTPITPYLSEQQHQQQQQQQQKKTTHRREGYKEKYKTIKSAQADREKIANSNTILFDLRVRSGRHAHILTS